MNFLNNILKAILKYISNLLKPALGNVIVEEKKDLLLDIQEKLKELLEANKSKDKRIEELEKEVLEKDILIKKQNKKKDKKKQFKKPDDNPRGFDPRGDKVKMEESDDSDDEMANEVSFEDEEAIEGDLGSESDKKKYKVETVLFGTNRDHTESNSELKFGNNNDTLKFGKCEISIPKSHKIGEIERPFMGWKFLENVNKHIVIQDVALLNEMDFENLVCSEISNDSENKAFLFIHGYNSTFEAAARRTAQMKYDMKFKGAALFYSWPSSGSEEQYFKDGEMTQLSESHLKDFILMVLECSDIDGLYIIGHSMGTRPLCNVVGEIIHMDPKYKDLIKEVILAAPDINAEIFIKNIVPVFKRQNKVITLYASSTDLALKSSRKINGFRRAGESGNRIIIESGVETIDATGVETDLVDVVKHSYFAENDSVINDIVDLILREERPGSRDNLKDIVDNNGKYWKFKTKEEREKVTS